MSEDFVYSQSLSTFRQVLFKMFLIMSHNFVNVYYILDGMHISVSVCVYIHIYIFIHIFQISNKIHYKYYAVLMWVLSCVQLIVTAWTVAHQSLLPSGHGIFQAMEWVAISYSRGSSWCRDQTCISCISCIGRQILYHCTTGESHSTYTMYNMPMTTSFN